MSKGEPVREKLQDELLRSTVVLQALPDGAVICDRMGIVRFINPAAERLLQIDSDVYLAQPSSNLPGGIVLSGDSGDQVSEQLIVVGYEDIRCKIIPIFSEHPKKVRLGFLITVKPVFLEALSLYELRTIIGFEFRAPLSSIIGYSDLLLRNLVGEISDHQREIIQIVSNLSRRLSSVVNNVMAISGFDFNKMSLLIEKTNIPEVVNDVIDSKRVLISGRNVACDVTILPHDLRVEIDQYKLHEILSHLIDNAFRYTPSGGNVSINVRMVSGQLRCDIQDTGIGISESAWSRIFDRFVFDNFTTIQKTCARLPCS